jgi:hypothetical protein
MIVCLTLCYRMDSQGKQRENAQVDKQQGRKYQSTRRGGLFRSSDESSVMGVERRE